MLSPLSDPRERHPYRQGSKKRAGRTLDHSPHLAATALRTLEWFIIFFYPSPTHLTTCGPLNCPISLTWTRLRKNLLGVLKPFIHHFIYCPRAFLLHSCWAISQKSPQRPRRPQRAHLILVQGYDCLMFWD